MTSLPIAHGQIIFLLVRVEGKDVIQIDRTTKHIFNNKRFITNMYERKLTGPVFFSKLNVPSLILPKLLRNYIHAEGIISVFELSG